MVSRLAIAALSTRRFRALLVSLVSLASGVLISAFASSANSANLADNYPTRPVRLMVTFPAGGGIDLIARTVAQKLSDAWGYQFVIENRAGGGGVIGTEIVARDAPDGHTLLTARGTGLVINPLLIAKLPYDPFRDFAPISLLAINPTLLCVHPSTPVTSVKELIAYARAKPRPLNYASAGNGSPIHLGMELFKSLTATEMLHVPYKSSVPTSLGLIDGAIRLASFDDAGAQRADIQAFMPRVNVDVAPGAILPRWSDVTVLLKNGRKLHQQVSVARGDAGAPLSDAELTNKVIDCFAFGQFKGKAQAFAQRVLNMGSAPVSETIRALRN